MRLFIIMVTFDTPLYIRLFSMYFQIRFSFTGSCVILFLNVVKMILHPGKKCHRIDNATFEIFLRENIMCLIYNYELIVLNQLVIKLVCLPASSSDFCSLNF